MTRLFSSISVETILASGITSSQTSMVVATGTGTALLGGVTLAAGNVDQFTVAIDPDTTSEEIVFITAISGDTFTIVRGQAGSTAITHASGATVRHVLTSSDLIYFNTAVQPATLTAKGDTYAATGSGVVTRQPVGTDGYALVADSTQTTGLKYAQQGDVFLTASQTLTNKTLTAPVATVALNAQTGTTYTFVLSDASKFVTCSNASAIAVSIPTNASVAFPIGTIINVQQIGAGQVTIAATTPGTTTVTSAGATSASPKTRAQYSAATCIKTGTDTWTVVGDIA